MRDNDDCRARLYDAQIYFPIARLFLSTNQLPVGNRQDDQGDRTKMPGIDQKPVYVQKEEVFVSAQPISWEPTPQVANLLINFKFDDGREIELLHYIYGKPNIESIRNSPANVLACIDEYARTSKYLMNVGEAKGAIVTDLIADVKPKTMVELGGYIGYSCILFGDAVKRAGGQRYYSLERNPEFAAVIASLVDLAGLSDVVKVVVGSSDASIKRLHSEGKLSDGIDLMFLDHYKPAYTTDLKLCEELELIKPGHTVLAADNVISPGNPPYLEYVRSSVADKQAALQDAQKNGGGVDARFKDRTANQYKKREGDEKLDSNVKGVPTLVYESRLVNSFEPTGEKVS